MIREMHWSPKTVDVQGCKFRPALKWGTWIACSPAGQRSPVMPHAHIKLQLPPPGSVDAEASTLQGQGGCRPCPAALPGTAGCRTRWQQRLDRCLWHDPGQSRGRNTDPATSFAAKECLRPKNYILSSEKIVTSNRNFVKWKCISLLCTK